MEQPTQDVLLEFESHFRSLFGKLLLKCKTNTFCIKLGHIVHFLQVLIFKLLMFALIMNLSIHFLNYINL